MTNKMRDDFEHWMLNVAKIIVGSDDPYVKSLEKTRWETWQAACASVDRSETFHIYLLSYISRS